ncbi:hypothetical protein [Spirochaeta isovalerica]|uniref:TolB-like protein n=1 Tax=Spirochaeta isovalerica TaxID=150 RepID=A0A841REX6_9SPIO|nr:hypothetical protein [Spirochaeta isovalerica]MBB6482543.1 TolB-like protein [Spirochaeta isovalerica]
MAAIKKILLISFTLFALLSCMTGSGKTTSTGMDVAELDSLIQDMAERIIPLLPAEKEANIAVYYFTVNGEESPYSDYLINNLTTEIANRAPQNCHVVSRKGLDRIMDEYSFQLSDLVSEETQVNIGELLGADTIITGYITPLGDSNSINVQLMDVHTGAVSGGFTMNVSGDIQLGSGQVSDRITMERQYSTTSGAATTTTIYESFDGPVTEVMPGFFEEHWGEHILTISGETDVDPGGYAYLNFSAQLDTDDYRAIREDSDMTFYLDLPLNAPPLDSDGFYVKVKPSGFTGAYIMVRQTIDDEHIVLGVPISLRQGEWNELRIPFGNLKLLEGEDRMDREENISITLGVPYFDNVVQGYLKGISVEGSLSVDELGLYSLKENMDDQGIISTFEDEILKAVPSLHTEGGLFYVDYSNSDSGMEKLNRGIESSRLEWRIAESGPVGKFFTVAGEYRLNDQINTFLDEGGEVALVLDLFFEKRPDDFEKLTFLLSSEGLTTGYLYLSNPEEAEAFETDIRTGRSWSRVSIDFSDLLYSEEDSGADWDDPVMMRTIWPIAPSILRNALGEEGLLELSLNIDELSWE